MPSTSKIKVWIPVLLLLVNVIFTLFLVEELLDASEPNYGYLGFLTPIIAVLSFLYINKFIGDNPSYFVRVLKGFNWFFIIFPLLVLVMMILAFL